MLVEQLHTCASENVTINVKLYILFQCLFCVICVKNNLFMTTSAVLSLNGVSFIGIPYAAQRTLYKQMKRLLWTLSDLFYRTLELI
jgi:hypothetical protein